MRLWSMHPGYLDGKGLVALWREGLLAQKVLQGNTKGYKNHPQLRRFKNTGNPAGAIASYLRCAVDEADNRGYNFDRSKIINKKFKGKIPVTSGQLEYEFTHLLGKLKGRDPELYTRLNKVKRIELHPIFYRVSGDVEDWEAYVMGGPH
ncbi:pyrimidine dimer DNA glycosylase/endonuclease V [Deltaproteobacteria bacterium]|nr:pyrimidine dimer DNA glycosylase/endonuclease V [Deltaproteobacteria bacterium]